jgi:hypothetical protein
LNSEQVTSLEQKITNLAPDIVGGLGLGLTTTWGGQTKILDNINSQTKPSAITNATSAGVCQATKPGGCANNNLGNLFNQNAKGLIDAAGNAASIANGVILTRMEGVLNTVRRTTDSIKTTTGLTQGIVAHGTYGLQAVQNFASTAWKATHADKIMNAITVAMVIHNGMMLSNNLLATVSEATNMTLQALGIRNSDDTEIDIGAAVKAKIATILTSILGAEQYKALTTRIAAANRVYQASANVYNLVREIGETSRSITEVACENTGKIGNALLESGVVFEDAYEQMLDSVNPQSKAQLKLEKFRNGVEVLENASEAISSISSDVIELQELKTEVTEGKEQLDTAREEFKTAMETKKEEIKTESKAETDVKKADFGKNETEE